VPEQELDLREIPAILAAQLGASPTEVVSSEVLDPDLLRKVCSTISGNSPKQT
jgi:hypothetical protein